MKRSYRIALVMLGTSQGLVGCSNPSSTGVPTTLMQEHYKQREDCVHDWGDDPANCTESTHSNAGGGTDRVYSGPRFYWDRSIGAPIAVDPQGQTRVVPNSHWTRGQPSRANEISQSSQSVVRKGFGSTGSRIGRRTGGG